MSTLTRRDMLKVAGMSTAALAAPRLLRAADAPRRPNIILILADDYGIDGVGCYGSDRYKTPHIDALASQGTRFEICHATPLCGPTRCQLITGRYPFRTGGLTNGSWGKGGAGPRAADETSIARLVKSAGYVTCSAGKWRQVGETPGDWGFDEWITDPTASGWFWQKSYTKNGELVELDKEIYYEDVIHDFAMDFLRRQRQGPFFLYYPTHLVHGPILRTPDSAPDSQDLYADNVAYLDKVVGKTVAEVDKLGLRENTLILFTGDNGTAGKSGTVGGRQLNGAKGSMWEGGTRVPLIASWKGTTPAGRVNSDLVDCSDFYATCGDLAGAQPPQGVTIDGRSFAPQLRGQPGKPRPWVFVQLGKQWYVKERDWKLNQTGELYNLKDAPFVEALVPADAQDAPAADARKRLQAVLAGLNPAAGKTEAIKPKAAKAAKKKAEQGKKAKKAQKQAVQ